MLKQHAKMVYRFLLVSDMCLTVFSFYAAYLIRNTMLDKWVAGGLYPFEYYTWLIFAIVPAWFLLLKAFNTYRSYRTASILDELIAVGKSAAVGGLFIGVIAYATKAEYLSRTFIALFICVNILLLGIERVAVRSITRAVRKYGYNTRNVVIVGTGTAAAEVASSLENADQLGLRLLGYVTTGGPAEGTKIDESRIIGGLADMEQILKRKVVDEVIFAVSEMKLKDYEDVLLLIEEQGINARIVANIFPHVIARLRVEELESIPLLTFSTVPSNTVALAVKRMIDVLLSMALLLLAAPLMVVAAALIKLTSAGPVLFKQKRSGLHGRTFTLYKFRSMFLDAETQRKEVEQLNEMDGPVFKIRNDPRITRIGHFLRRTSIDELPQLWNVLKGDMSIVGPRPPIPEEVEKYERWQRRRLSMRPGLTCIWQISGRNKIKDFNTWVKLDLLYIDTWSLALDFKIFLKTIPVVMLQKGAR